MSDNIDDRKLDKQSDRAATRGESSIANSSENSVVKNLEKQRQESFTSDLLKSISHDDAELKNRSLQIVDGDQVILDSHKKQSEMSSNVPGIKDRLLAQNKTMEPLQGRVTSEELYTQPDDNGVVPFGGPIDKPHVSNHHKTTFYQSLTIGITGRYNGLVADKDVLNINISDGINNGKVFDGNPHHIVAPINPSPGSMRHWKWIDATVQSHAGNVSLTIHKLSPKTSAPTSDKDWDIVDSRYGTFPLIRSTKPQYMKARDYWSLTTGGRVEDPAASKHHRRRLEINEKVTD